MLKDFAYWLLRDEFKAAKRADDDMMAIIRQQRKEIDQLKREVTAVSDRGYQNGARVGRLEDWRRRVSATEPADLGYGVSNMPWGRPFGDAFRGQSSGANWLNSDDFRAKLDAENHGLKEELERNYIAPEGGEGVAQAAQSKEVV